MENGPRLRPQDLATAKDVLCEVEECKHNCFTPVVMIKTVSALVSPNGKEVNVPLQVFACTKCGHINKDFLPDFSS